MYAPQDLSRVEAEKLVREIAKDSSRVSLSRHAKEQMAERGIGNSQVFTCLRKGVVTEGPSFNQHGNWQVTMTRLAAGLELDVVVAIEWPDNLVIVTAF